MHTASRFRMPTGMNIRTNMNMPASTDIFTSKNRPTSTNTLMNTHSHGPGHVHSPEEKKRRLNRISRIIGHLEHVRRMIEEDYDCADILVQLSAVRSATNGLAKQIIHEHIEHCVSEAVESGDEETLEKLQNAIDKFI